MLELECELGNHESKSMSQVRKWKIDPPVIVKGAEMLASNCFSGVTSLENDSVWLHLTLDTQITPR